MRRLIPAVLVCLGGVVVAAWSGGRPGKERREPVAAGVTGTPWFGSAHHRWRAPTPVNAQREQSAPKELIERVGAWAEVFLLRCPEYAATERREESRSGKKASKRVMVAEYTVRRDNGGRIAETRKLVSVDGREAKDGDKALEVSGLHNPFAIVSQLAERNRERMKFVFAQDTSDVEVGGDYILLGYRQVEGDGLAELDGKAVYPRGQAWVDPNDGHVWRIEDEVAHKDKRYVTVVEFSQENALNTWLPQQITARVFSKGLLEHHVEIAYSGFRKLAPAERAGTSVSPPKP